MNLGNQLVEKIREANSDYLIVPNPDFLHRKEIEEAIKANDGYCCCAL